MFSLSREALLMTLVGSIRVAFIHIYYAKCWY